MTDSTNQNTPQAPIVHLNGTSVESLIEQWNEIGLAVIKARQLLMENAPNQRDYYVKSGAWEKARKEHNDRLAKLSSIESDVASVIEQIDSQHR